MKRAKNIFLATVISPELVVLLIVVGGFVLSPDVFDNLGRKLLSDSEVWKFLPSLTLLFSGAAFTFSSKLRAPLENASNKALYEWPLYPMLVDRVMLSLCLSGICGVAGLMLWIIGQSLPGAVVGAVFLAATGVSATTALTMLLAHQKLRELIDRYGS